MGRLAIAFGAALAVTAAGCGGEAATADLSPAADGGDDLSVALDAGSDGNAGEGGANDLAGPCVPGMARVDRGDAGQVCVDRFEGALVELTDGGERPWPYDHTLTATASVRAVPADGIKPQAYISEVQAAAACARSGKRLCTLDEWLAACQGPSGSTYPYGDTYEKGACNEGRATNPVNDCFGPNAPFNDANLNSPCCDDQPNTVAPGGSFQRCVSAWGIYDLHGNLHEWISNPTATGNGIFKGGFFVDATLNGPGCLYKTTAHAQSYHDYSTGFRCCADPR